jgi:hypothetical protein
MPLFLLNKRLPEWNLEVVSYDAATHTAVLRGVTRMITDTNFYPRIVKRAYDLSDVEPDNLKGVSHAECTGV